MGNRGHENGATTAATKVLPVTHFFLEYNVMRAAELFDTCFELAPGHRISASQLCAILKLAGCTEKEKHVCVWLNERFGAHEFVRKVRPHNVRTWIGIKPRVQLATCDTCGATRLRLSHDPR